MSDENWTPPTELPSAPFIEDVLQLIRNERNRQLEKWGRQEHPATDLMVPSPLNVFGRYKIPSDYEAKAACQEAAKNGHPSWTGILLEEFCEAVAASTDDPHGSELLAELVQVAAVATAWAELVVERRAIRALGSSIHADPERR